MAGTYYSVQLDYDSGIITLNSLEGVFELLKEKQCIAVYRCNDPITGKQYAELADKLSFSAEQQEAFPVCVTTVLSEEGYFVESEEFWIENYMVDEFYYPDRMPYIESMASYD